MRKRRWSRGGALGLVLAVAALALLAAFTAANVATLNLRVSSTVANSSVAESLAESVVQQALANLQEDLGKNDPVSIDGKTMGLPDGSRGYLTFEKSSGLPYSTNNFLGDSADGWNRTLPESTAHLVGVGECGGVTRHVEVVAHLPEFPVVMGCDGPVVVENSFIGGFEPEDEREWVPGDGYSVEDDEVGPGHLVSNQSIVLDRRSKVTGDTQSKSTIQLRQGSTVDGEVRQNWGKKAPLPKFDLEKFDPAKDEDIHYDKLRNPGSSLNLVGNVRRTGNLYLTGDMRLDNAFLFVEGDLTVQGDLRGQGAIVALGKVVFEGTTDIAGNEQLAVLARGGITVSGRDASRSVFKGLLYSEGPFKAEKITIVGGFVVEKGSPTSVVDSQVFFSGVNIVPPIRRETYAAIPRFTIPDGTLTDNGLKEDPETGMPFVRWKPTASSPIRNVSNVIDEDDPDWRISDWKLSDPAIIKVTWVNDEPRIIYQWWGSGPTLGTLPRAPLEYWTDPEEAAAYIAAENTGENFLTTGECDVLGNLDGSPPNKEQYRLFVLSVINHLQKLNHPTGDYNFAIDPNEFVGDDEEIRILLHRSF